MLVCGNNAEMQKVLNNRGAACWRQLDNLVLTAWCCWGMQQFCTRPRNLPSLACWKRRRASCAGSPGSAGISSAHPDLQIWGKVSTHTRCPPCGSWQPCHGYQTDLQLVSCTAMQGSCKQMIAYKPQSGYTSYTTTERCPPSSRELLALPAKRSSASTTAPMASKASLHTDHAQHRHCSLPDKATPLASSLGDLLPQ